MRARLLSSSILLVAACSTDTFQSGDAGDDAGTDASLSDVVGSDVIGSGDASAGDASPDASVPFSCNPARAGSLLCDTFDNVSAVTDKWTTSLVSSQGKVALDSNAALSPPKSFSSLLQQDNNSQYALLFFQDVSATYQTSSIRAAVRVNVVDTAQIVPLLRISYQSATGSGKVSVYVAAFAGVFVMETSEPASDGGFNNGTPINVGAYKVDTWSVVQLDFRQGPSANVKVFLDGVLRSSTTPILFSPQTAIREFEVGASGTPGSADMLVNFDDVDVAGF